MLRVCIASIQNVERSLLLLVVSASVQLNCTAYNANLFCSIFFVVVVDAGCDKQDHRCVVVGAVNCMVAVAIVVRTAPVINRIARYSSRIATLPTPPAFDAAVWRVPVTILQ